jgi:hypothetical protein
LNAKKNALREFQYPNNLKRPMPGWIRRIRVKNLKPKSPSLSFKPKGALELNLRSTGIIE